MAGFFHSDCRPRWQPSVLTTVCVDNRLCWASADEQFRDSGAVLGGSSEELFIALGPADIEMHVVFPRVTDAAMKLNALFRKEALRVASGGFR